MDLREKIRDVIREAASEGEGWLLECQAETYADEILALPEIKEALVLWGMATEYRGPRPPTSD